MTSDASAGNPFHGWPRPLAFALSGGGAFGSVHVGMLRALLERGVRPDLVVGTSVGALHGALLAAQLDDAVPIMEQLWRSMDRRKVFGGRRTVVRSLLRTRTLSDFSRLEGLIDRHLPVAEFAQFEIPFAAVATDALTGEPDLLDSGPIRAALLASAAVPGLFPPVEVSGRLYIDGGVSANVPIRQAIAFGAASVISIDATPAIVATAPAQTLAGGLLQSMSLMLRNQRSHAVDELVHRYRIAELPSPTPADMGSFNFSHTAELIDASHGLTATTLDQWTDESMIIEDR